MTRLTPELIRQIPDTLPEYDLELKIKTGSTLLEIAKRSTNARKGIEKLLKRSRASVVPVTAGGGTIEGFAEAVTATLQYIGLTANVTATLDVAGLAEAVAGGCELVFAADDDIFAGFNLRKRKVVNNSTATGWAYAAALELTAKGVRGKPVSIIGVGRVGSAAASYLAQRRAEIHVFDVNLIEANRLRSLHPKSVHVCNSLHECLSKSSLILLAAPATGLVDETLVKEDAIVSAPAIPLPLTKEALRKIPERNLMHDPLQLGVAVMAVELLNP